MKIIAIIQARMGSSRLPGKIMADICGKPLLQYVVDRVERSNVDEIVVACPEADWDKIKIDHREYRVPFGVEFLPGDENDVVGRFARVLEGHPCNAFVRVCADSPLIDPRMISYLVDTIEKDAQTGQTYRICQGVCGTGERLLTTSFFQQYPKMTGPYCREHVTTAWRATACPPLPTGMPKLTVDTQDDLDRMRRLVSRMIRPHWEYGEMECLLLA